MCRNITPLRGLEPPATSDEVEAAARQYVRKVAAATATQMSSPAVERAVAEISAATAELLAALPPRRQPPAVVPPLRRRTTATREGGAVPATGVAPRTAPDGRR